jgi:hypothetical protein
MKKEENIKKYQVIVCNKIKIDFEKKKELN